MRGVSLRPDTAEILAILAGVFILVNALLLAATGFAFAGSLTAAGLLVGFGIAGLGVGLGRAGGNRRGLGAAILVLSLVAFFPVSGFYLGAILGVAAGGIALTGPSTRTWGGARSSGATSLGAPCPRCGRPVPSWSTRCPYCGFPEEGG